jgi:branched-chain amino acid transport system permease protein
VNIPQTLFDGLALGALYALVAVGLALVFGVMRLINFAQGELITAGAYSLSLTGSLPLVASIVICFVVCIGLALLLVLVAFRRLRGSDPTTALVTTFAVALTLEAVWIIAFGTNGKPADLLSTLNQTVVNGSFLLRWVTIAMIGGGGLLLAATGLILTRTSIGLQMRAAARDFRAARLLGVRTNRVIAFAFALSGVFAAVVALLYTVQVPDVTPTFGLDITIVALVGAVTGGIERLWRATAGGFVIGFANAVLGDVLHSSERIYVTSFVFLLVIIVLLVRPDGLFAPLRNRSTERV